MSACNTNNDPTLTDETGTNKNSAETPQNKILRGAHYQLVSFNSDVIKGDSTTLSWDNQDKLRVYFCETYTASAMMQTGTIKPASIQTSSPIYDCKNPKLLKTQNAFLQGLKEGISLEVKQNKINAEEKDLYFKTKSGDTFVYEWIVTFIE